MSPDRIPSLRARLTRALVGLGLVSVVLLAVVNFVVVRELLDTTVREQLTTLRDLRRDRIETGVDRLLDHVSVIATDPGLADALVDLDAGYGALDAELSAAQLAQLEAAYDEVVQVYDDAGVDRPAVSDLLPTLPAGRAVQFGYIADNPNPSSERAELLDAGDGSSYSAAHRELHPYLRSLAASVSAEDLLLVSARSDDVVYSVEKRVDLGTDVVSGPYGDTGLGKVWDRLQVSSVSDAVIVDAAFYLPDASVPIFHVGATVRKDTEVVGAVVIELSIENLTAIVTEQEQWDLLGLGDTGDAYVVGADGRLRTVPRPWFDDPERYIERYLDNGGDERTADLMSFTGSPVLLHEIDNEAVDTAIGGEQFVGIVDNGLGTRSLTAARPLELPGLDWFVVTEQATEETRSELVQFVWSTLVLLAILLPILAVVGTVLARIFARPVDPLVGTAHEIADGNFEAEVPDLGRNELGDLGRQLEHVAARLRERQASAAAEEDRIMELLASVVPTSLVERVRRGERDITELVDTATVVSVTILGLPEPSGAEQDAVLDLTERMATVMDELTREYGLERIRVASDQQLFVAGRGRPDTDATSAVTFAVAAVDRIAEVGAAFGVPLSARAGLASGLVASGVLGSRQMSFALWGEAAMRSIELSESSDWDGVVIDASVAEHVDGDVEMEPIPSGTPLGDARLAIRVVGDSTTTSIRPGSSPAN